MKRIIIILISFLLGVAFIPTINHFKKEILKERVLYKIKIENEFINLRSSIDLKPEPIMKVYKDEIYEVVEYYEGNSFNWYRIIYNGSSTGWIASGKSKAWVSVIEGTNCNSDQNIGGESDED